MALAFCLKFVPDVYLQCTFIVATPCAALITPLSAVHLYVPVSFRLILVNNKVFPLGWIRLLSSFFVQVMFGSGLPVALQNIVAEDDSMTVWVFGYITSMAGETDEKRQSHASLFKPQKTTNFFN